jgi:hypothetical protein
MLVTSLIVPNWRVDPVPQVAKIVTLEVMVPLE